MIKTLTAQFRDLRDRSANRERIFIFFVVPGGIYFLFIVMIFVVVRYRSLGFGPLYVLGLLLVIVGVVAMIRTNDNMRGVNVSRVESDPVPEGHPLSLRVTVSNSSPEGMRRSLVVRLAGWKNYSRFVFLPEIGPKSSVKVCLELPTTKRGLVDIPAVVVSSRFPLGLCVSWKYVRCLHKAVVFPLPEGRPLKLEGDDSDGAVAVGGNVESGYEDVTGHRAYAAGDSPSQIDWRVFARTGKLYVRTMEGDAPKEFVLRWEQTESLGGAEARLRQLSRWIDDCLRAGLGFRLELGASQKELSHRNLVGCWVALAGFEEEDDA